MVHNHHGDVLLLAQSQQTGTDKRSARQVEGPLGFLADAICGARLPLVLGRAAKVFNLEGQFDTGGDDLARDSLVRDQCRPQHLMSAHDLAQRLTKSRNVEAANERDSRRHVIRRAARFQLIEKPEPLLCE